MTSVRNKTRWLKLAIIALFATAIPVLLWAQRGGEMESEGGGANSLLQAVKRRELAGSVHKNLSCSTCHGESEMGIGKVDPVTTCASCHTQAAEAFAKSIHATALERGNTNSASCISCHNSHDVEAVSNPQARVSRMRVSMQTCATCHESPKWTETDPVPPNVVADFQQSFHGLSAALGDQRTANCASCHSAHEILPSSNPFSTVSPKNLAQTCAACHTGANDVPPFAATAASATGDIPTSAPDGTQTSATGGVPTFATGGVHYNPAVTGFKIVDWVKTAYLILIIVTLSLMFLHNAIDFWGRLRERLKRRRGEKPKEVIKVERNLIQTLPTEGGAAILEKPEIPAKTASEKILTYLRYTVVERIQHWTLAASFITLALTGFALKYGWQFPFLEAQQGALLRGFLHRAAAIVFIALAIYHVGYMTLTKRGRLNFRAFVPHVHSAGDIACHITAWFRLGPPSRQDWRDLIQTVKYNLGLVPDLPAMGRFTYAEKMEYFALLWGSSVMIFTGLILWSEVTFLKSFQYWVYELATAAHFYEALLATLSIILWHFYYTIYNPLVFPLSKVMITGEMSREEMERDHALELKTIEEEAAKKSRIPEQ